MRAEFGGEWIHVCMTESLPCSPETIATLLIGYTPIQNEKFFFKNRITTQVVKGKEKQRNDRYKGQVGKKPMGVFWVFACYVSSSWYWLHGGHFTIII